MKKTLTLLLVVFLVMAVCVSCSKKNDAAGSSASETKNAGKKIIRIMTFTDEVPKMIERYIALHPEFAEKYEVDATIIATTDGLYQPALDEALMSGGKDAPDMYCAESAFVLKYTQGDASQFAATYKSLGIDVDKEIKNSDIAKYSVEIGSRNGEVVGLGYQATGGCFIYRRSIAKDVWGDDSPEFVAKKIGAGSQNWDQFFKAAAELRAKGYGIVSGDGDIWHAVENSSKKGWIVNGELNIDPAREAFLDLSKELKDNDYHNDTQDWEEGWYADMRDAGRKKIFGYFGPAWLINYVLAGNCGDTFGDWAVCAPNVGFFWGGTWILANKDTKNKEGVAELIKWITLDSSETGLQYYWANGTLTEGSTQDTVASGTVMAKSNGKVAFLNNQNMFEQFVPANQYANGSNLTQYDETINTYWRDQVRQYTAGNKSRSQAIEDFKARVKENLDVIVK